MLGQGQSGKEAAVFEDEGLLRGEHGELLGLGEGSCRLRGGAFGCFGVGQVGVGLDEGLLGARLVGIGEGASVEAREG